MDVQTSYGIQTNFFFSIFAQKHATVTFVYPNLFLKLWPTRESIRPFIGLSIACFFVKGNELDNIMNYIQIFPPFKQRQAQRRCYPRRPHPFLV